MEFYEHELMKDMTHRCGKKKNYKFAQRVTSVTNGRLSPWPLLPRRPLQKRWSWAGGKWRDRGCRVRLHISVMHFVSKGTGFYSCSGSFLTDSHLSLTGLTGDLCVRLSFEVEFKGWVWGRVHSFIVVVAVCVCFFVFTSCSELGWALHCPSGPTLRCHSPSHHTGPGFTERQN